jgi:hypothetical protein
MQSCHPSGSRERPEALCNFAVPFDRYPSKKDTLLQELEKSSFSPLRPVPAVDLDQSESGVRMFDHLKGGLAAFPPAGVIDNGTCAPFQAGDHACSGGNGRRRLRHRR